ncbi:hypothetical protein I3843_10G112600 [Carya illinoinensis]|nr:hypothetical protein I3843_10G112600 [Carya illinoinensis]
MRLASFYTRVLVEQHRGCRCCMCMGRCFNRPPQVKREIS